MAQRKPDAKRTAPITPAWTRAEACELAVAVEAVCAPLKCHVALTGGCLYKPGARKDVDLLFYRERDINEIDLPRLYEGLASIGFVITDGGHALKWCVKAKFQGKAVDLFFPEAKNDEHISEASVQPVELAGVEDDWLSAL